MSSFTHFQNLFREVIQTKNEMKFAINNKKNPAIKLFIYTPFPLQFVHFYS